MPEMKLVCVCTVQGEITPTCAQMSKKCCETRAGENSQKLLA